MTWDGRRCCLRRTTDGAWCLLIDPHEGECMTPQPMQFGPIEPSPDRRLMAAHRAEVSRKWGKP